jgi:hypothetical protein
MPLLTTAETMSFCHIFDSFFFSELFERGSWDGGEDSGVDIHRDDLVVGISVRRGGGSGVWTGIVRSWGS